MLRIHSNSTEEVPPGREAYRAHSKCEDVLKYASRLECTTVPYVDHWFRTYLSCRNYDPIRVEVKADDVIGVAVEESLDVGDSVHYDSQGGCMVYDVPVLQVADVVTTIVRTVAVGVLQLQLNSRSLVLIQWVLVVTGWLLQTTHPRLHVDVVLLFLFFFIYLLLVLVVLINLLKFY